MQFSSHSLSYIAYSEEELFIERKCGLLPTTPKKLKLCENHFVNEWISHLEADIPDLFKVLGDWSWDRWIDYDTLGDYETEGS